MTAFNYFGLNMLSTENRFSQERWEVFPGHKVTVTVDAAQLVTTWLAGFPPFAPKEYNHG